MLLIICGIEWPMMCWYHDAVKKLYSLTPRSLCY